MKQYLAALILLAGASGAAAAEPPAVRLTPKDHDTPIDRDYLRVYAEARLDWQNFWYDGTTDKASSGFKGQYLMVRFDGEIMPGLTYSWRQRLNKDPKDFNATDWLYLNYATGRWNFNAGKEVVAIGGYEYDRNPIDLYGCSVFWNNIPCYQFGVTAGYGLTASDRLSLQIGQSPFHTPAHNNMYAYNLMWNGSHGWYEAIWSANLMEFAPGHYINYIALGNKFKYGKAWLELDLMNRAASHQRFLFKDASVMAELSYSPDARWRVYGKYTYDINNSGTDADMVVADGTRLNMAGAGVEYYVLGNARHRLRLHADAYYSWGQAGSPSNPMQNKTTYLSCGLIWDMNLINIKRK